MKSIAISTYNRVNDVEKLIDQIFIHKVTLLSSYKLNKSNWLEV